jgi:7,8-dihydropterin-6-yl-methyl-4-(beta-D-ribofuranosyl)aminobenzene 5'-phosphate synthase
MRRIITLAGLVLILLGGGMGFAWIKGRGMKMEEKKEFVSPSLSLAETELTLITVYDNNQYDPCLKTGWGFSCLVKFKDKNILFDTGTDAPTLLANMEKLGIDPKEIKIIVISHIHGDHVNGLWGLLERAGEAKVYIPASFPDSFREKIKSYGANYQNVRGPIQLKEGIYSTGELGTFIKEQALVVKTEKGLVVLIGCAHPGVVNLVRKAKEVVGEGIHLISGGFHLLNTPGSEIEEIIADLKNLGVKKVAPCHCSGERARHLFKESFSENYIENGVGRKIEI